MSRPRPSERQERAWRRTVRKYAPAYLFLAPNFLGVLVFIAFPVFFALYMSFQDWNGVTPPRFVGLGNFHDLFADPIVWRALKNTGVYTLLTVPVGVAFSLGVAALLYQRVRGLALFRTPMFIPVFTSALAVAVIW